MVRARLIIAKNERAGSMVLWRTRRSKGAVPRRCSCIAADLRFWLFCGVRLNIPAFWTGVVCLLFIRNGMLDIHMFTCFRGNYFAAEAFVHHCTQSHISYDLESTPDDNASPHRDRIRTRRISTDYLFCTVPYGITVPCRVSQYLAGAIRSAFFLFF